MVTHPFSNFADCYDAVRNDSMGKLRQAAWKRLEMGWPTKKNPEWQFSNTESLDVAAKPSGKQVVDAASLARFQIKDDEISIVFVDGHLDAKLSRGMEKVRAEPIVSSTSAHGILREKIGELDAISLLAVATAADGLHIRFEKNATTPRVHLIHVQTGKGDYRPTTHVVSCGESSESSLVESFVHLDRDHGFTNHFTFIHAAPNSKLEFTRVQKEDRASRAVQGLLIEAERDANVHSTLLSIGATWSRQSARALLLAPGADITLNGVYFTQREQHVDIWTRVEHLAPHTSSRESFKSILDDKGHGAFTGNVLVAKDAQKVVSNQENRNLLLSRQAKVDTTPQLEIHADDVKCGHGSTIGRLDDAQIFFLRARGISETHARMILTRAFAADVINSIRDLGVREQLNKYLHLWFVKHQEHLVRVD